MENRYICYRGLNTVTNPAIEKITHGFPFNSTAVAFSLAPLVNASMRTNRNEIALSAFIADDVKDPVKDLKKSKDIQNTEVEELLPGIIEMCESQNHQKCIFVVMDCEADIRGMIGNKLLERYKRPLFVLGDFGDYYAGSSRAVGVEDFRAMCEETGLCEANGHELAFGINVDKKDYFKFVEAIRNKLADIEFETNTDIDALIDINDVNQGLIDNIKALDFLSGTGHEPIKFKINGITNYEVGNMSQGKHLKITTENGITLIKWNFSGSFDEFEEAAMWNEELEVIGTLDSGFIGRTYMLKVICDEIKII